MLLAIDVGNSEICFGLFNKSEIVCNWRIETRKNRTADEYAVLILSLLEHYKLSYSQIKGVCVSSVVPFIDVKIREFCEDCFKIKPFFITSASVLGFSLNVETPLEIGADRLANTAYAINHMVLPALVIDIGTAITFDYVSDKKSYEGGVILPGLNMAMMALNIGTAKLPPVDIKWPNSVIGRSTSTCIQSGILFGYCSMIDGLIEKFELELKKNLNTVLTGGFSFLLKDRLKNQVTYVKHLTLEGIRLIYELNIRPLS